MSIKPINKSQLLNSLPSEWSDDPLPKIQEMVRASSHKLVVLDDDPTGTQTVYGIPVLTEWSVESLCVELESDQPAFYLLTNSRSMPLERAKALNREIGRNLLEAARQTNRQFSVVSRSDSTLRGHYPGEVDALTEILGQEVDASLIIPFFLEGGRYTIHDVHYVAEGDLLTPAAETPFAQDATFGYKTSNLKEWVEEKTAGRVQADTVATITIDDIRLGGPERVAARLLALPKGCVCAINAASYRDMEVFVLGLLLAEAQGKQFVYRTAASFVRVRAGLAERAILTKAELNLSAQNGGLVVAGSYVPKTTQQLQALMAQGNIVAIEVGVEQLLDDESYAKVVAQIGTEASKALQRGQDVMIYTSRDLVTVDEPEENLQLGERVSQGLVQIVRAISVQPRYILAKGGITSSDTATLGLDVKRATVMGQILPGIPVWQLGVESRYPNLPYIVFPGNVGDVNAVADVVKALSNWGE